MKNQALVRVNEKRIPCKFVNIYSVVFHCDSTNRKLFPIPFEMKFFNIFITTLLLSLFKLQGIPRARDVRVNQP